MRISHNIYWSAALPASICCLILYLKALSCGFILWDDTEFVVNNLPLRSFDANLFVWSFTTIAPFSGIWIPLTWISFAVDYQFWGLNPFGYHLTNILLHAANVFLLVLIGDYLCRDVFRDRGLPTRTGMLALFLAGLVYGIHPLRVESVAWVTERKDVLNGFFTFAAILFYLRFVQQDVPQDRRTRDYLLSLACFLLSLMAKPVSVVLPAMLLVADWHLARLDTIPLRRIAWEKIPYVTVATAITVTTLACASGTGGVLVSMKTLPLADRFLASGNAIYQYLRLTIVPFGIVPYDPLPTPIPASYLFSCGVVVVVAGAVIWTRNRILMATALCFILPLIPTLAFFQNNDHAYAARYTYLPEAIPSIVAVAWLVVQVTRLAIPWRRGALTFITAGMAGAILCYGISTERLIEVWHDTGTFWSRIIEVTPLGRAYQERGMYHFAKGEYVLAIEDLTRAIEIAESLGMHDRYNLDAFRGEAYRNVKRYAEAANDFTTAIGKAPRPVYFYHRGLALQELGRRDEASRDFLRAGSETGAIDWY